MATKPVKDGPHHVMREMWMKTMRYHHAPTREETLTSPKSGQKAEGEDLPFTAGE